MAIAEGNGMGSSCKYCYLSGACANKHVDSLQCVGEDKCEFSGLNVMTARRTNLGSEGQGVHARWLGLYCEEHRRFHCGCGSRPSLYAKKGIPGPAEPRQRDRNPLEDW